MGAPRRAARATPSCSPSPSLVGDGRRRIARERCYFCDAVQKQARVECLALLNLRGYWKIRFSAKGNTDCLKSILLLSLKSSKDFQC